MNVTKGSTILVKGFVNIEGNAEVIGSDRIKFFESEKYVPIYCLEDCKIEVNGEYKILDCPTIPESWEKLAKKEWETVFLYGGVDSGKSTLATYLANKVGGAYVLDLDIGQADIAHAGAMGYGFAKDVVNLSQVEMINGFFVGSISPQGREARCLRGVARLWKELKKLEGRKIVDTTGWIRGRRAKEYKLAKLEIIEPDLVVSFEGRPFDDWKVFEVENGFVVKRDKIERARARCESYKKFLKNAKVMEIEKEKVRIRPDIFKGKDVSNFIETVLDAELVFAKLGEDFLTICTKESCSPDYTILRELKELYEVDDILIFSESEFRNLIVGLYKDKKYLGLGLLKALNKTITIESAFSEFDLLEIGEIRFDEGKECFLRRV
ncbi:MAG: Clp1/GlmU family protein [Archaeoglobaceae archaeon]|nr:Clp1/GlmU family protein [Archaeoglobaceae archaeon]